MTKATWFKLLGMAVVLMLVAGVYAADEKTLKGTITCAKCDLKVKDQTKCATVIVVKEKVKDKDEDVVYWFDADSHKKNHQEVCKEAKKGTVKGEVGEDKENKRKTIKVSELKFDK